MRTVIVEPFRRSAGPHTPRRPGSAPRSGRGPHRRGGGRGAVPRHPAAGGLGAGFLTRCGRPFVPGTGVGGTIGGRRVIARTGNSGDVRPEQVVVPEQEAIDIPDGLEAVRALAALHDGMLVQHRLELAPVAAVDRVLVAPRRPAAWGTGSSHWPRPSVPPSSARPVDRTRCAPSTGSARILAVDYRDDRWIEQSEGPFDVVFDGAGGAIGRTALSRTVRRGPVPRLRSGQR